MTIFLFLLRPPDCVFFVTPYKFYITIPLGLTSLVQQAPTKYVHLNWPNNWYPIPPWTYFSKTVTSLKKHVYVFGQTSTLPSSCLRCYFMDAFLTVQHCLSISWFSSCLFFHGRNFISRFSTFTFFLIWFLINYIFLPPLLYYGKYKVLNMRLRKPYNQIFIDTNKIRIERNDKS